MSEPDYDEIDMALHRARVEGEPAEIHGTLCALLCSQAVPAGRTWIDDEVLAGHAAGDDLETCRRLLTELWRVTREQLGGNDYALRLLLPADDTPAAERGAALAAWCDGFLYGLGLAGEDALDSLSAEAREFINDITEFIQVDTDIEESDDADAALMEIAEYVRVGVHMVYQELASPEDSGDLPAGAVRH